MNKRIVAATCLVFLCACAKPGANAVPPTPSPKATLLYVEPTVQAPYGSYLEYYIVQKDGLFGVVDGSGNVTLPIQYGTIREIYRSEADAVYFAALGNDASGRLYHANGKLLYDNVPAEAFALADGFVSFCVPSGLYGVINAEGAVVVPFVYDQIDALGSGFAGIKGDTDAVIKTVEVYDRAGSLLRSKKINYAYSFKDFMVVTDKSGKKYGLMNDLFQTVVKPAYDSISDAGDGQLYVGVNGKGGIVDQKGRVILPASYLLWGDNDQKLIYPQLDKDGHIAHFIATSADGKTSYVFDRNGKSLFRSKEYEFLSYQDGILRRLDKESGDEQAIGANGKVLYTAGLVMYQRDAQLFLCVGIGQEGSDETYSAVFKSDGSRLFKTDATFVYCLSPDRFILELTGMDGFVNRSVLCDGSGRILGPESGYTLELGDGKTLLYNTDEGTNTKAGLLDYDGKVLAPAIYTDLSQFPGQKLFYVQTKDVHGLIDRNGKWVWSAPGVVDWWGYYGSPDE